MKPVFADTSFYVALFNPGDVHYEKAVRLARETRRAVVLTEFVLLELANALARASSRKLFVDLLPKLRADPNVKVIAFRPSCSSMVARCMPTGLTKTGP